MGNIPAGYVPLGLVGFTDQGTYNPDGIYMENDLVHVSNAIWKCKVDNTQRIAPAENANWTIFINSSTELAGIAAVDEKGVLGSPGGIVVSQSLIDAIAQKVMEDLVPYSKIVNNLLSTDIRTALSGPMGKKLADDLTSLNSEMSLWLGQMPIIKNTDISDTAKYRYCRLFAATGDVPFGTPGDNDFFLVSYWYATGGESFVAQTAYNIRGDDVRHRRYNNGWHPWHT